jgi:hypothetical protein
MSCHIGVMANTLRLQPYDVVYMTAAPVARWNRLVSQLLPTISGSITTANAICSTTFLCMRGQYLPFSAAERLPERYQPRLVFACAGGQGANAWPVAGRSPRPPTHRRYGPWLHFIFRIIYAQNITPKFSKNAGIDNVTAANYGCDTFVLDNINVINNAGLLTGYGTVKDRYLSIAQNFRINQLLLNNKALPCNVRGAQIAAGTPALFISLTNMMLRYASLELHNKPQRLFMRNLLVM